jgi:signal transduction histidine kinase
MQPASSLSNRIFVACFLLATLSLGFAFAWVNRSVSRGAEAELRRGLEETVDLVTRQRSSTLTDTFTRHARLVAELSNLKAAVDTGDPPTVKPLVDDYREGIGADLLLVTSPGGTILGRSGADGLALPEAATGPQALDEHVAFIAEPPGLLHVISVPILLKAEPLGRLTVGVFLDRDWALQFKRLTRSDIAFAAGGRVLASSMPAEWHATLEAVARARTPTPIAIGDTDYLALSAPMRQGAIHRGSFDDGDASVIVLRSRTEHLQFLSTLRAGVGGAMLVAVLLATVVSFVVARTITRPLAAVTGAMAHVAATGDLSRRVSVRSRVWDDEDARLLATAFNTLTESIARFQREEAQKNRLSALGRLSTVIAHEIRNPLMIIRASLRTLRRDAVTPAERREAVADIDEETARINRTVTEVLDFAKPMRFDLAEAQVNDICRASAAAAWADDRQPEVALELDPRLPPIITDAERLRTALVNILTNARNAVRAPDMTSAAGDGATVRVLTGHAGGRVTIAVRDRGTGIAADDLPHVFDPYFTTRRTGTGLGLPIAKNIVEGLGGAIRVTSHPGEGTEIVIDLPLVQAGTAVA